MTKELFRDSSNFVGTARSYRIIALKLIYRSFGSGVGMQG